MLPILMCNMSMNAQTDSLMFGEKFITNSKMIGIGATNILDTYLSPEKYTGTDVRYISHTLKQRQGNRLSMKLFIKVIFHLLIIVPVTERRCLATIIFNMVCIICLILGI